VDVPRTHSVWQTSGRLIGPTQKPIPDNTQNSQETNTLGHRGIRTRNSKKREDADPRLRPHG